jgi:hypothetical protein
MKFKSFVVSALFITAISAVSPALASPSHHQQELRSARQSEKPVMRDPMVLAKAGMVPVVMQSDPEAYRDKWPFNLDLG